jgi:hypothetical protein
MIGTNKAANYFEQQKLFEKNNQEISKLAFGERTYNDWASFNKVHNFAIFK